MHFLQKIILTIGVLFFALSLSAQTEFQYKIHIEANTVEGLDGLHSYAFGTTDNKWVFIGGRRDGIHARQPFNAFPVNENNTTIYVVDQETYEVSTANVSSLPTNLKEQLQSTNMEFFQDGAVLYFLGGYGYSTSEEDHITYPYLTAIDLNGLADDVIAGESINDNFEQITDDVFAVTGGYLGKFGDEFILVGGHRFDGRYNPMDHPTFVQEYTNQIRKFKINNSGGLEYMDYSSITDEVNLHRRDYNLVPQIFPDGTFGYTIFSGVFQVNQNLPFLYPVDIRPDGHFPAYDFNQLLCNYHSANVALYDSTANVMHNLFFGGISQYYYENGNLVQDNDIPFVKTISRVSRDSEGVLEEVALAQQMPAYLGAGAEFIPNQDLTFVEDEIIKMDDLEGDSILLGHIFGGIESPALNPFTYNNTEVTFASNTLFEIYLIKEETTALTNTLSGYHDFNIKVFPNPTKKSIFNVKMQLPDSGDIDILLSDSQGKIGYNDTLEDFEEGESQIELEMLIEEPGVHFLTIILNGKYFSSEKIVFLGD